MADVGREQHISKTDARAGVTLHAMRFVLGISLALAVIGMLFVLWR